MAIGAWSFPATRPATAEIAAWLSGLSLAGLGRPAGAQPEWTRDAARSARAWLRLVDEGRDGASWSTASSLLRAEVGPGDWSAALQVSRAPLGKCRWRALRSSEALEGPPGDLRGPYVVLRFESSFEGRPSIVETVTPVRGPDGRWRVAAYFLA
jgi:hypothetical protein